MEATNWVCAYCQDNNVSIYEFSMVMQETYILEALNYDVDIPCIVQWKMLWFSAPTGRNNDLLSGGVILEKYHETVNKALKSASVLTYWRMNTPGVCFMKSIRAMLEGTIWPKMITDFTVAV